MFFFRPVATRKSFLTFDKRNRGDAQNSARARTRVACKVEDVNAFILVETQCHNREVNNPALCADNERKHSAVFGGF